MTKNKIIIVKENPITIIQVDDQDFISLADMSKSFGDDTAIYSWMRNRNTVEFPGIWEQLNNLHFKGDNFVTFKMKVQHVIFVIIKNMNQFTAKIYKIGINPYVLLPREVLKQLFIQAGKDKGPIPVCGTLNGYKFIQTLIKYSGKWRLYLNGPMRKGAGIDVGDMAEVKIKYDGAVRSVTMHPKLEAALKKNKKAKSTFEKLPPSRQKEIIRYISFLKSEESIDKNVSRAIGFLSGKERFIGRDKPL